MGATGHGDHGDGGGGCGDCGHGYYAMVGAGPWERVGVAGGVAGVPCASEDSRSCTARPSHMPSWSSSLLAMAIAMAIASSSLMSGTLSYLA